ncbi:MAG TPA: TonB-dependent receptor [Phenylobacterium sp.]
MRVRAAILASASALAFATLATPGLAAEAPSAIDEVVVTATRVQTLASKTPVALTAITGEGLTAAGITNPTTLGEQVPNLSIVRGNGLQITIRGVTSTDGTEKGDPSAAFLLDGIYIARPQAQEVSFYDLKRVEVLRGPQGTLYGRNTTAGLVNLITATPEHEFGGSIDGVYASFDTIQLTGVVNVPVNEKVALRAAVNYDRRDSYLREGVASPVTLDPFKKNLSGRLSALFDFTDDMSLVVRADYSEIRGVPTNAVFSTNFFNGPFTVGSMPVYVDRGAKTQRTLDYAPLWQTSRDNSTWGVQAEYNWSFAPDLTLTYLGAYREFTRHEKSDFVRGRNRATSDGNYWQNSQEVRLAYQHEALQFQAGGYYFKERSGIEFFILDPQNLGLPANATRFGFPQDPTIAESYAGFAQATYEVAPQLKLTAGVRYSHDDKSRVGATVFDTTAGNRVVLQTNNAQRNFEKVTYRLGADYDISSLGLVYVTFSTGYKAGGFNDGCETGTAPGCGQTAGALYYQPETLTAYEGGFKFHFNELGLRLNGALFHYDYKGLQLSSLTNVCGGPCQVTTNAAKAKVDGAEFEATYAPVEHHRLDLNLNWLRARYADFHPTPAFDFAGLALDRSPKWSGAVGYSYTRSVGEGSIVAAARVRFSERYRLTQLSPVVFFRQPSFHKTDLTLTYNAPEDRYYLQAFAKNLENEIALTSATNSATASTAVFEDPRTVGVRVGYHF